MHDPNLGALVKLPFWTKTTAFFVLNFLTGHHSQGIGYCIWRASAWYSVERFQIGQGAASLGLDLLVLDLGCTSLWDKGMRSVPLLRALLAALATLGTSISYMISFFLSFAAAFSGLDLPGPGRRSVHRSRYRYFSPHWDDLEEMMIICWWFYFTSGWSASSLCLIIAAACLVISPAILALILLW